MSWIEVIDPDSNNVYYYNTESGDSSWDMPIDYIPKESDSNVVNNEIDEGITWIQETDEETSRTFLINPLSKVRVWEIVYDTASQSHFYWDEATGSTTWDRPIFQDKEQDTTGSTTNNNNEVEEELTWIQETDEETSRTFLINPLTNLRGWEIVYDTASQSHFYWDEATGSTTWDRPIFQYDKGIVTESDTVKHTEIKSNANKQDDFLSQVLSPSTLDKLQTISQSNTSSFISTSLLALLSLNPLSSSPKKSNSSRFGSRDENDELFYSNTDNNVTEKPTVDSVDIFGLPTSETINWSSINVTAIVNKMKEQSLKNYAEKYFDIDKSLSPTQLNDIIHNKLSWKSEQLKEPLCLLSKELSIEAIACSKHISAFVGDRKTEKNQMHHASILLKHMLKAPKELRDEVYCQICKKIEGNPSFECTWSAWQLLAFCFATFPPSDELYQPLLGFLSNNIDGGGYHEFRKFAEFSLRSCILSSRCPVRKEIPSLNELNILRGAESKITVRVNYLDEEVANIDANCWMLAREFTNIFIKAIDLKPQSSKAFAFYVESPSGSKVIEPEDRMCDVIGAISVDEPSETNKIVYKVRYFFDDDSNLYAEDPMAFNLYYAQAVSDVYSGKYPCSKVDYLVLSALRAQEKYGDNLPILDKEGGNAAKDSITDTFFWQLIVPSALFDNDNDRPNTLKQFFRIHKRLRGYSSSDAKSAFMDHVRSFKVYGSHFFFATYSASIDNSSNQNSETSPVRSSSDDSIVNNNQINDVVIAISNKALTVLQVETTFILLQFKYDQNLTWVYSNKSIIIMVSSDDGKSRKRYYLKTNQGKEINNFLNIYTNRT